MDQQGGQFDAFAFFGEVQQRDSKQKLRADIMDAFDDGLSDHPSAGGVDRPDIWNVVAESLPRRPGGHSTPGHADQNSVLGPSTGAGASDAKELGPERIRDGPPAGQGIASTEAASGRAAAGRADDVGAEGLATAPSFTYFGAGEEHEMEEEDAAFEQALRGRRAPLQRLAEGAREAEQLLQAPTGSDDASPASPAFAAAPGKGRSRRSGAGSGRSRGKPE